LWSGPQGPVARLRLPWQLRQYARLRSVLKRLLRRIDALIWGRFHPPI
jgi:hypothetical protein